MTTRRVASKGLLGLKRRDMRTAAIDGLPAAASQDQVALSIDPPLVARAKPVHAPSCLRRGNARVGGRAVVLVAASDACAAHAHLAHACCGTRRVVIVPHTHGRPWRRVFWAEVSESMVLRLAFSSGSVFHADVDGVSAGAFSSDL